MVNFHLKLKIFSSYLVLIGKKIPLTLTKGLFTKQENSPL